MKSPSAGRSASRLNACGEGSGWAVSLAIHIIEDMYYYGNARNALKSPAPTTAQPPVSYFLRNCTLMVSLEIIAAISCCGTGVLVRVASRSTALCGTAKR